MVENVAGLNAVDVSEDVNDSPRAACPVMAESGLWCCPYTRTPYKLPNACHWASLQRARHFPSAAVETCYPTGASPAAEEKALHGPIRERSIRAGSSWLPPLPGSTDETHHEKVAAARPLLSTDYGSYLRHGVLNSSSVRLPLDKLPQ